MRLLILEVYQRLTNSQTVNSEVGIVDQAGLQGRIVSDYRHGH